MTTLKSILIEDSDIAIIERLHDMLLIKYEVPITHPLLKESRALTQGLIRAMQGED